MALPTNNSRPAIPYVPTQVLPNYDRYESLGQFPPTAQQLDGDLNKMIDLINTLSDEINHVVVGALPGADDPLNANSLMTTDGAGNISWVKASSANLDEGAVTTPKIANAAITSEKIQPQAITTEKLANEAVTNLQMATNSTKIDKLRSSGHSCFVIGDDADYNYKELLAPADYSIPTRIANTTKPSMQPFSVFWNAQPNTSLSGAKIANTSLSGIQLQNQTITNAQIANNTISQAQIDAAFAQSLVPTGCIMPFAATNAPDGWLACTGVAVSRQTYAALFAVIGTTYGAGDGSTTFNVPDLRGRAMFGFIGSTNGLITTATADKVALGGKGGEETHVLTTNEIPSHSHSIAAYPYGDSTLANVPRGGNPSGGGPTLPTTQNAGGGQAHTNMPPFILMNFIIKT